MWGKIASVDLLRLLHCREYTANVNQPARGKVNALVEAQTSSVKTIVNVEQDLESHARTKCVCTSKMYAGVPTSYFFYYSYLLPLPVLVVGSVMRKKFDG